MKSVLPHPNKNPIPVHKPRWIKPLLIATTVLIVLRLTGIIEIPDEWLVGAIVIEVGLAIFELTVFIIVFRHFYSQHRGKGKDSFAAVAAAQIDELRNSGLPEIIARPLGKVIAFEMSIYRNIYRFFRRRV